jgi:hypothetical protein
LTKAKIYGIIYIVRKTKREVKKMNRNEVKQYLRLNFPNIEATGDIELHGTKWICEIKKNGYWFIVDVQISELAQTA